MQTDAPIASANAHDSTKTTPSSVRRATPVAHSSRAVRVSLARAFPVQIAGMREALQSGCVTKLTRP